MEIRKKDVSLGPQIIDRGKKSTKAARQQENWENYKYSFSR